MNERTTCTNCMYRRAIHPVMPKYTVCHYLLDTGEARGCPAHSCTHWQSDAKGTEQWLVLLELIKEANIIDR